MAKAYSGVLAVVALSLAITRGLVLGLLADEILVQCLGFLLLFAFIGYAIGYMADSVVQNSVETRFREEMAALHARNATDDSQVNQG